MEGTSFDDQKRGAETGSGLVSIGFGGSGAKQKRDPTPFPRRDRSELACESIELWRREQGREHYSDADELLVLCDGGGSNSSSHYLFKEDLQTLSNRLKLKIRIAHYPPYCSKYNPIEHRVFPHITRACKGVPLETIETAKHYMEKTQTTTGLNVVVRIIDKVYEIGRKYAEDFKEMMTIKFHKHLPKWNYNAIPDTT